MTQIAQIQRALAAAGYSPGLIDGAWGPVTAGALRRWEAANGRVANGLLDALIIDVVFVCRRHKTKLMVCDDTKVGGWRGHLNPLLAEGRRNKKMPGTCMPGGIRM